MGKQENLVYFTMLVMALITGYSLYVSGQTTDLPKSSSGLYERIVWTNKETYELGETVEAAILFINHGDQPLEIYPIYSYTFSGNSVYDPKQITGKVFVDYAEDKITIPANGNLTFQSGSFKPTYPGPFKITGLGITKTVNVTGFKEVSLNSTGMSLVIKPSVSKPKDRDYVEFSFVIENNNPYPVRLPIVTKIYTGLSPNELRPSIFIDWLYPHIGIAPYSERLLCSKGFQVRYPGFSLFMSANGVMASIELEVEQ